MKRRVDDMLKEVAIVKAVLVTAILLGLAVLPGCQATQAVAGAQVANDVSFQAAIVRVCSPLATPAALRSLNKEQMTAREIFCDSMGGQVNE